MIKLYLVELRIYLMRHLGHFKTGHFNLIQGPQGVQPGGGHLAGVVLGGFLEAVINWGNRANVGKSCPSSRDSAAFRD